MIRNFSPIRFALSPAGLLAVAGLLFHPASTAAAELPRTIASPPCTKAPVVDGVFGPDEWKEAAVFRFEMPMFEFKPFAMRGPRAAELRVMNSANALHIALRVPNAVSHASLIPLELDMAILAFSRSEAVTVGDDRKAIAPGLFRDKYVSAPGQSEDDPQQDGRGATGYVDGCYTFEWSVPLGAEDRNDLRASPGDAIRFNIAFFDRFSADFKQTQAGGLFGPDLDKAVAWGTMRLAATATNDGGPALTGAPLDPNFELDVTYAAPGGQELKLDFLRPDGDGPFPLIVCVHGGAWQGGSRTDLRSFQTAFAASGFASASVQYRFPPKNRFPAQLEDIIAAVRFLLQNHERFRIDPDRVGFTGGSAGAHLALLAAFSKIEGCHVRAVVNLAGPTDLRTFLSAPTGDAALKSVVNRDSAELVADLLGTADRRADIYAAASPVAQVHANGPAVLTIHGVADDIVPVTQAEALHAALKKIGATERLIAVPGGGHDMGGWPMTERLAVFRDTIDYFAAHLKSAPPPETPVTK